MVHSDDVLVGETTLQLVLDGPPLLVGKDGTHFAPFLDLELTCHPATLSLQILHAYHILENTILEYYHKSANFELPSGTIRSTLHFRRSVLTKTDLSENKHLSIQTGHSTFAFSSRALACPMLFVHLLKPPVVVHVFDSLEDLAWQEYKVTKKVRI